MAYIDLGDLKSYLDVSGATDNALLQEAIDDAESYINSQTNRVFEATTATRYYGREALDDHDCTILHLDGDLLTITTLTNGDSSSTAITSGNYWLLDRNYGPPYHAIQLKTNISTYWQWDTDYWVSVLGTWGYAATVPADIMRATTVLAGYFYRQKDAQIFDVTAIPEAGVITIPQGIPSTVTKVIERYKRYL